MIVEISPQFTSSRRVSLPIALFAFVVFVCALPSEAACPDFASAVHYGVETAPTSVAAGDFNRDGRPDLAVANYDSNAISILLGSGNGTFAAAVNYVVGGGPQAVAIGDFNNDGKADVAVANFVSNNVSVLLGNGNGTFAMAVGYGVGTGPNGIAIGDFNRDGKTDLAVANYVSNTVSIMLGNGNGTFAGATNWNAGGGAASVAVGDFNRDGKADLAVADPNSDQVSILIGNGGGSFAAPAGFSTGSRPSAVAIGDFNGDGKIDVATANYNSNNISILLGNGNGMLAAAASYAAGTNPISVDAGDFNGDGKTDVAVANFSSNNVSFLFGNGNGTFGAPTNRNTDLNPGSVAAGDFNGDGRADVAVANSSSNTVSIVINTGICARQCGGVAATMNLPAVQPNAVVIGDFNRDGKPDLASAGGPLNEFPTPGTLSIRIGNGDGSFAAPTNYTTGVFPLSAVTADFNGDGNPDLAVANTEDNNVSIFLGDGTGFFATAANYSVGGGPLSIAVGDFNGDGVPDLVTANSDQDFGSQNPDHISILIGSGNGSFAAPVLYAAHLHPDSVAVGDFNRDGKIDIAAANANSDDVSIFLGSGNGTFAGAVNYGTSGEPRALAVADFNNDGKADLAIACARALTVSILMGNGDGTFTAAPNRSAGSYPSAVAVADLNGDGKADLAVANADSIYGPNDLSFLLGNGDGTFSARTNLDTGIQSSAVAAGDFNRDGKIDLALANFSSSTVSILTGACADLTITKSHAGNFTAPQTGATYTLTVNNAGTGSTISAVTVTDILPDNLTATAVSGPGWSCNLGTLTCTRGASLNGGASYPITLTVNVAATAPANLINTASVSGGGEINLANDSASDPTTIVPVPDLTIAKSHSGSFGDTGTYTIVVQNTGGASTAGAVNVTDALPAGMTGMTMSGTGWSCNLGNLTCTRSNALPISTAYPPITLIVSVHNGIAASVINTANVSGGGDVSAGNKSASDPTNIILAPTNLVATATSTSEVILSWDSNNADNYQIERSSNNSPFTLVGTQMQNVSADSNVSANTTYLYRVRAIVSGYVGLPSNVDLATTIVFNETIVPTFTTVKASHITELRTTVNAVRAAAGMPAASFTDNPLTGVFIKAVHITELRAFLDAARSAIGVPAWTYTDPSLAAGYMVRDAHIEDLRNAVR